MFLAETGLDAVAPGDRYVLDGAEGRHAGVVQRRGRGERLDVVDGDGLRLRCVVESADAGRVTLLVQEVDREPAPTVVVTLVQALAKGDRDELAVQAATELGVDEIVPWQAARSVSRWSPEKAVKGRARWSSIVREAAKQAHRPWIPEVSAVATTAELSARAADARVLLLEPTAGEALSAWTPDPADVRDILLVVGPEGGIAPEELDRLSGSGAHAVRLGREVLRTSTAGPAAIVLLSAALGRW